MKAPVADGILDDEGMGGQSDCLALGGPWGEVIECLGIPWRHLPWNCWKVCFGRLSKREHQNLNPKAQTLDKPEVCSSAPAAALRTTELCIVGSIGLWVCAFCSSKSLIVRLRLCPSTVLALQVPGRDIIGLQPTTTPGRHDLMPPWWDRITQVYYQKITDLSKPSISIPSCCQWGSFRADHNSWVNRSQETMPMLFGH